MRRDLYRFVGAGVVNTALTFVAYQLLLFVVPPELAYALTWLIGLTFVAVVYPSRVFVGGDRSVRARALIVLVYFVGFGLGLGVVSIVSRNLGMQRSAVVAALVVTMASNFLGMRLVSRGMPDSRNRVSQ